VARLGAQRHRKIFDTGELTTPPGPELVEIIDALIGEMVARYGTAYPSA
jgi:hypothetical protein